jgi:hypothetical protein
MASTKERAVLALKAVPYTVATTVLLTKEADIRDVERCRLREPPTLADLVWLLVTCDEV